MDLDFRNPGLQYSIDSILMFQSEEQTEWWRETLFLIYPQLDRRHFDSLCPEGRKTYMEEALKAVYAQAEDEITDKIPKYQAYWLDNRPQVEAAFSQAFQLDARELLNDLQVNITLNPISPRFLAEHTFDVFYRNSPKGALGASLHELVHFVWFTAWQACFGDDPSEYEAPSLKWVFSEMVVDPVMRDQRLRSINPYFDGGCAYDYFYTMRIDGKPILDTLYAMLTANPIQEFMKLGYKYCLEHEGQIRDQMR